MKKRIIPSALWLCVSLCSLAANPSLAGLEWETTSRTIEVHPLQASATIVFPFTNAGVEAVKIIDLKPTCGCISGKVGKKIYDLGVSGVIEVEFNMEKRVGPQRKGISIQTNDGKTTSLYISANIQPSFTLSSKRLIWDSGEERTPKSLVIINQHRIPFRLKEAIPAREGVTVELVTKREGFEYELIVTPAPELKNILIPITIHPELPEGLGKVKTFTAYVLLK